MRRDSKLLDLPTPPTAIFASNDNMAVGVLRAARERGFVVPDQLSVVGFDDAVLAPNVNPSLTTVRQPLAELGRTAISLLMRMLDRQRVEALRVELATKLVIRESTGPTVRALMEARRTKSAPFALSFMSANYVARELGYGMADQWGPFDDATNAAFEPLESFGARFDALLVSITDIGFDAIDLWFGHLNWRWATPDHVVIARDALDAPRRAAREPGREHRDDDRRRGSRMPPRERPRAST